MRHSIYSIVSILLGMTITIIREESVFVPQRSKYKSPFSLKMDVEPQTTINEVRCNVEHLMPGALTRTSELYFNNNIIPEFVPKPTRHELYLDYMSTGTSLVVGVLDFMVPKNPTLKDISVVSDSTLYIEEPLLGKLINLKMLHS